MAGDGEVELFASIVDSGGIEDTGGISLHKGRKQHHVEVFEKLCFRKNAFHELDGVSALTHSRELIRFKNQINQ
jgi:hypothetical protein